jgi:GH25 family lysozyme M1 (1,4-beta-N-acetylmuramidase)
MVFGGSDLIVVVSSAPEKIVRFLSTAVVLGLALAFGPERAWAQRPLGIDVSHYQGFINWTSAKTSGVAFAWSKATENTNFTDPFFTLNQANATAAGVLIGAYHFARPEDNIGLAGADLEAAYFWNTASNYIKGGGRYLMPVLDIESDLSSASPPYTKTTLSQWVNRWCQDIVNFAASNGVTVKPVIYTYTSYATTWLDSTVTNQPLWMAYYPANPNPQTGAPSSTSPWATWNVWQFDNTNTILSGVTGNCDVDVFNGTAAGVGALVIGGLDSPYFTSQPVNNRVIDAGGSASFSATAAGIPPPNFQWLLNNTPISGATNAILNITNAQSTNAGNYTLILSNASGSATSSVVSLTVYPVQTPVFSDAFDSDTTPNWIVNRSSSDTAVAFNFDYSTLGIPSAPHSVGGTTLGVQMKANLTLGVVAALSLSPTNQSFSGDYRLHFDGWINVNGPFPAGGPGSTEFLTAGIGTAGNRAEWTGSGSTADGFYFSVDGEGGVSGGSSTAGDYSGYAGTVWQNATSGIYDAGSLDAASVYYAAAFPGSQSAPALQQANYAQQTGVLNPGTFGLAWHDVIVSRRGSTVDWVVDGIKMATISNATFTANNIFVGFWDPFASLSSNNIINFGLVDNVRVEVPAIAPIITTDPQPQLVKLGTNVTFTAAASGLPAPNFQWRFNGTNIASTTNTSFSLAYVAATNTGNYSVIATNVAGAATSSTAALALLPPAPAQFQSISLPGGGVQISFTGDAFWTYTIEVSTNLTSWSPLTNLTSADGRFNFTTSLATNSPQQFYRARAGP